jgi:hypothetical protein
MEADGTLFRGAKSMIDSNITGIFETGVTAQDWLNQGKADAWSGVPKCPPETPPEAASLYDLGYSEGKITHPFNLKKTGS